MNIPPISPIAIPPPSQASSPPSNSVKKISNAVRHFFSNVVSPKLTSCISTLKNDIRKIKRGAFSGLISGGAATGIAGAGLYATNRELALFVVSKAIPLFGALASMKALISGAFFVAGGAMLKPGIEMGAMEAGLSAGAGVVNISQGSISFASALSGLGIFPSATLIAVAAITGPVLIALGTIILSLILGIQLARATKVLRILENPNQLSSRELLHQLITPTEEEIQKTAQKYQISEQRAQASLCEFKRNNLSSILGEDLVAQMISTLQTSEADEATYSLLIHKAKKAAFKTVIDKRINLGITLIGGLGSVAGAVVHPVFFALTGLATGYALLNIFLDTNEQIGNRLAKRKYFSAPQPSP